MILSLFLGVIIIPSVIRPFLFKEKWGVPTGPDVTIGQNCMYIIHQTFVQKKVIIRAIFFSLSFFCGVVFILFWNRILSLCSPGWSQIQRAACLCHLNAVFKHMSYYYACFRERDSLDSTLRRRLEKNHLTLKSNTTKTSGKTNINERTIKHIFPPR